MARGDINEYYDPRHERQMAQMLKDSREMLKQGHLGGIASVMTRLGRRKKEALDEEKRKTAGRSLSKALMAKPWRDPNTAITAEDIADVEGGTPMPAEIAPGQLPQGIERATGVLTDEVALHPDNPYMGRDLRNLLTQNIARKTVLGDRDEERRHKASLLEKEHARKKELLQEAGPFGGKSSEMTYRRILQRASPNSKQYAAAYSALAAGRVTVTPDGNTTTVTPDMSMYLPPTFRVGDGQPATAVVPQPATAVVPQPATAVVPQPVGTVGQPTITQTGRRLPRLTTAEKRVDIEFAKHYAEAFIGGKAADTQKQINQLGVSIELLKGSDNITGPAISALPDALRERFYPASADAQEKVAEVTQRNLKAVLGGQFTEKEGDKLIARAYNPRLEEAYNIQRVTALKDAIQKAFDAKVAAAQYYEGEGNGSLRGYKGTKFWSMADIEAHALGPAGVSEEDIQETMRANAMSRRSVIDRLNGVTP